MNSKQSTVSFTINGDIIQDIASFFNVGDVLSYHKTSAGKSNHTYFIENSNSLQYAIRILRRPNLSSLENERFVQTLLENKKVSTNYMLLSPNGLYLYKKNGIIATISKRIEGRHPKSPVSIEECRLIGATLARFHQALEKRSLPYENTASPLMNTSIQSRLDRLSSSAYRRRIEKLLLATSHMESERELPRGIIHGDLHVDNLLINGNQVSILDLESMSEGPLVLDIGRSIADVCSHMKELDDRKVAGFLKGYQAYRKLIPKEERLVRSAITHGAAAISAWFYEYGDYVFAEHFLSVGFYAVNAAVK